MRKLAVVLGTLFVMLLAMAPLPARAGGAETKVEGIVQAGSTIAGLPAGAEAEAKWQTVVSGSTAGKKCAVKNVTNPLAITRAQGTTLADTSVFPSAHLACSIATSTIPGISPGNVVCADVNFSNAASLTKNCNAVTGTAVTLQPGTWRVRNNNTGQTATSSITELEVELDD